MKTIKIFSFIAVLSVMLTSCAESWLESDPTAGMLTQDQFDELPNTIDGQVLGLYSLLYPVGDHDLFGQKTIDIVSDLISSDMAITQRGYGWFESDAMLTSTASNSGRASYFWSYHYYLIKNCNVVLKRIVEDPTLDTDPNLKNNYAQALAMRSYAYMGLYSLFTPSYSMETELGFSSDTLNTFPVYVETSRPDSAQGPAKALVVQKRIIDDFTKAIALFDETGYSRPNKLFFDKTLCKALLAKFYLEIGDNDKAFTAADDLITEVSGQYPILPKGELLSNGFNHQESTNWIWGLKTDVNNRGGLASFFGHICVYTYSYAWSGAIKAIDDELFYEDMRKQHPQDLRHMWFNSINKQLNPYNKFYSAKSDRAMVEQLDSARTWVNPGTTPAERDSLAVENKLLKATLQYEIDMNIDRDWLSDIVYMRIEELYLIAAEAAARIDNLPMAKLNLIELLKQRYDKPDADIETYVNGMDKTALLKELRYNWRVELWGEGKSLQVLRRFNETNKCGGNHFDTGKKEVKATAYGIFSIPYGETSTNPNM